MPRAGVFHQLLLPATLVLKQSEKAAGWQARKLCQLCLCGSETVQSMSLKGFVWGQGYRQASLHTSHPSWQGLVPRLIVDFLSWAVLVV